MRTFVLFAFSALCATALFAPAFAKPSCGGAGAVAEEKSDKSSFKEGKASASESNASTKINDANGNKYESDESSKEAKQSASSGSTDNSSKLYKDSNGNYVSQKSNKRELSASDSSSSSSSSYVKAEKAPSCGCSK